MNNCVNMVHHTETDERFLKYKKKMPYLKRQN